MKAIPLFARVLVKVTEKDKLTPGGIIIPDAAKEKPTEGVVLAIGSLCQTVKIDDRVLFSKYAGNEIVIDNEPVLILNEEDIQVRLEG